MMFLQFTTRSVLLLVASTPLLAQQALYQVDGGTPLLPTYFEMTVNGDFDGDHFLDIAVPGKAVYSGADGTTLIDLNETNFPGHRASYSVSFIKDFDGDLRDELVVQGRFSVAGGTYYGRVYVYGTATSSVLYTIDGDASHNDVGGAMSAIGDANGDGKEDFALALPFWDDAQGVQTGLIQVFSGPTGALLYEIEGSSSGETPFGWGLGPAGDLNNDGLADLAVWDSQAYSPVYGEVFVYSSANQSELLHWVGTNVQERIGSSVVPVEDLNQDSFPELLMATGYHPFGGSGPFDPRVLVVSGQTGAVLRELRGDSNDTGFPSSITSVQDMNQDGIREILVGSSANNGPNVGKVYVFSGMDGVRLSTIKGDSPGDFFGTKIASMGDLTGDGFDEIAVSMQVGFETRVQVLGNVFAGEGQHFCFATPNSTGKPARIQARLGSPGINYHLDAFGGPPDEYAYFLVGTHADIVAPGLLGQGQLCLGTTGGAQIGRYNHTGTARNSVGRFDAAGVLQNVVGTSASGPGFDIPVALPFLGSPSIVAGSTFHFQLWYRDNIASGVPANLSSGLSLTF